MTVISEFVDLFKKVVAPSIAPLAALFPNGEKKLGCSLIVNGDPPFLVTNYHVAEALLKTVETPRAIVQVGNLKIHPKERLRSWDRQMDLATLSLKREEIPFIFRVQVAACHSDALPL